MGRPEVLDMAAWLKEIVAKLPAVSHSHVARQRFVNSLLPQKPSDADVVKLVGDIASNVDTLCDVSHHGVIYNHALQ